jgi:hypothetical protein
MARPIKVPNLHPRRLQRVYKLWNDYSGGSVTPIEPTGSAGFAFSEVAHIGTMTREKEAHSTFSTWIGSFH